MESLEERKRALIAEITAAFDGVAREDGVSLHEAHVIDDYGSAEERAEARAMDTESCWQDVPDELIARGDSVLSFLDPKGFRYYIPAYIVWYLKYNVTDLDSRSDNCFPFEESNTPDSVLFHLGIRFGPAKPPDEYALKRYRLLTTEQSKAVAHFLVLVSEREEEWEVWEEAGWCERIANGEVSEEWVDALFKRRHQERAKPGPREYTALFALHNWWGQFL
jgi:hypothetical protein